LKILSIFYGLTVKNFPHFISKLAEEKIKSLLSKDGALGGEDKI
jgi:hypothetical protein